MVRKVTTAGGWGKRYGTHDPGRAMQGAARAIAAAPWQDPAWAEDLPGRLTQRFLDGRSLHPALAQPMHRTVRDIIQIETHALQLTPVAPSPALEAVGYRQRLRALINFKPRADQLLRDWTDSVGQILRRIADAAPVHAQNETATVGITAPLIDLIQHPNELVTEIVAQLLRFAHDDPVAVRPGAVLAGRIHQALLTTSKLTDDAARRNPHRIVSPMQSDLVGAELVSAYLGDTPLASLLNTPLPFLIPRKTYPEHGLVCAPTGGFKTQYLQATILNFLNERDPPAMFVLDSQDDDKGILYKLAHLDVFHPDHGRLRDRLIILSPEDKPALNLFKLGAEATERDDLFLYLTSAIDRELTTKMATAATYILRLLEKIPTPTIYTFKDILENPKKYSNYISLLDQTSQDFFNNQFNVKSEMGATRLQVASRLYTILGNRAFTDMFAAEHNRFDALKAMREKKIVLVNTSERKLGAVGSKVFGRFIVAQCMAAAMKRGSEKQRDLALLILDEAHQYFDERTEKILREARKFNLGLLAATQMYDAIDPKVKAALATNTAIKLAGAVSYKDAGDLAHEMRTSAEAILSCSKGEFQTYVRELTPHAVKLKVPYGVLENAPRMDDAAHPRMRERNRLALTLEDDGALRPSAVKSAPVSVAPPSRASQAQPTASHKPTGADEPLIKPGRDWKRRI